VVPEQETCFDVLEQEMDLMVLELEMDILVLELEMDFPYFSCVIFGDGYQTHTEHE